MIKRFLRKFRDFQNRPVKASLDETRDRLIHIEAKDNELKERLIHIEDRVLESNKRLVNIEEKVTATGHKNASDSMNNRLTAFENRLRQAELRCDRLESRNRELGFDQLGGRIDQRLTRLELLLHYSDKARYEKLGDAEKGIIRHLETGYMAGLPTKFPKIPTPPRTNDKENSPIRIEQEGDLFYWDFRGKRIYMSHSYESAHRMATALHREFFTDSPHRYLKPEEDGVDVPEGAIIADVGGAEGLFCMTFIDQAKKLYVFESEPRWISLLEKTFAPYKDKVVIVQGTVGNRAGDIKLDEYFSDKEKPTVVKMDIEGYEPFALGGMKEIINSDDPLTMLICTYHRQSDWDSFYEMLHEKYSITSSQGYFWHMPDPTPPFFRHGVMRAVKKINKEKNE